MKSYGYKKILYALIFAFIIVISNYTVQFHIGDTYLTYGALTYPFSFLLLDILSESNHRGEVVKMLRLGIIFAFLPSCFVSEPSIAIASISAFFVSQHIDVYLFFYIKRRLPKLWWLRNNASTIIAQFVDTIIFFNIAFFFEWTFKEIMFSALLDFCVKIFLSVIDTPFFYLFAIKLKIRLRKWWIL